MALSGFRAAKPRTVKWASQRVARRSWCLGLRLDAHGWQRWRRRRWKPLVLDTVVTCRVCVFAYPTAAPRNSGASVLTGSMSPASSTPTRRRDGHGSKYALAHDKAMWDGRLSRTGGGDDDAPRPVLSHLVSTRRAPRHRRIPARRACVTHRSCCLAPMAARLRRAPQACARRRPARLRGICGWWESRPFSGAGVGGVLASALSALTGSW
jgi:hypothetical protein